MASRIQTTISIVACLAAGALAFAGGFSQTGIEAEEDEFGAENIWTEVDLPVDYSASRERIAFELAAMQLFGPARSAGESGDPDAGPPAALYLIAIAELDGALFALIEEPGGKTQRLRQGQSTSSGWSVERIDKASAELSLNGETQRLELFAPRPDRKPDEPSRRKPEKKRK